MSAGPTGLTAACALLTGGVAVRVLERATIPAGTSRALGLQPRGAEVLKRVGALGDLPQRSLPIHQVIVIVAGRELGRLAVGRPTPLVQRPGLLVSQTEIESALRDRLAVLGGTVEWGRAVTDLRPGAGGVDIVLDDGEALRADWVIGCDGAHSRVRAAAGIQFPGVPLVEHFLLADVHVDLGVSRGTVAVWLRGGDLLAAFPLPGPDLWRLMAPAPDATDLAPNAVLGALTGLLNRHTGTAPVVRARPRPRPGDRVVDTEGIHEDGRATRLHAELGARWVLLVWPDAHLAWSGRSPAVLARWLTGALHRDPATGLADEPLPQAAGGKVGAIRK